MASDRPFTAGRLSWTRAAERLHREQSAFTLVELLLVMIIIAVLLAVAIPSYVGYKERAERHVAATNIRVAIPAVEAWHADHGTYTGMTQAALRTQIDAAVNLSQNPTILGGGTGYCVQSDSNGRSAGGEQTHRYTGPGGDTTPVAGSC